MKKHRQIIVPLEIYNEAFNLKKEYYKKTGLHIPLWKSVSAVENSRRLKGGFGGFNL